MKKENTVLAVIDCQNDFITGSLANTEAQKKVSNIVNKINEFNGSSIFVTRDTHQKDYLSTKEGEKLPVEHCIEETWGWELNDSIQDALNKAKIRGVNVVYVNKPTFGSEKLVEALRTDIKSSEFDIEICGFCTDICVVSNALLIKAAFYDKVNITVNASCTAGVTVDSHNAALTTMKMCQINVIDE